MRVLFHDADEWLKELGDDNEGGQVDAGIVRVCILAKTNGAVPIVTVTVRAGYAKADDTFELELFTGEAMADIPQERDGLSVARLRVELLEKAIMEMGLEVRGGYFAP